MKYSVAAAALLFAGSAVANYGPAVHTTTVTKTVYVKATAPCTKTKKTVTATVTSTRPCGDYVPIPPPTQEPVPAPKTYSVPAPAPPKYSPPPPPPKYTPPPPPPKYTPPKESPVPQPSPPPSYGTPPAGGSFAEDCVNTHNKYRAKHGAPPVKWDEKLVQKAKDRAFTCRFQHMRGTGYGENLAQGYKDVTAAIDGWYNEVSEYNYGSGGFSMSTGHFTQVVWKGTHSIGCIEDKDCSGGGTIHRCEYYPPGNYAGEYRSNVLP